MLREFPIVELDNSRHLCMTLSERIINEALGGMALSASEYPNFFVFGPMGISTYPISIISTKLIKDIMSFRIILNWILYKNTYQSVLRTKV